MSYEDGCPSVKNKGLSRFWALASAVTVIAFARPGMASTVSTPTFSPKAGTYTAAQSVAISSSTSGSTIYYTTNGSTPTTKSTKYSGKVTVSTSLTLKAIATKSGMTTSGTASGSYTIAIATAAPTFSPLPGTYATTQNVYINPPSSSSKVYYTVDGTTPTTASNLWYGASIWVSASTLIRAFAVESGKANSPVVNAQYNIVVDLRPTIQSLGIDVRNQGGRNTCVEEAMTFVQEYALAAIYGATYNHLSLDYFVQAGNVASGQTTEDSNGYKYTAGYFKYGSIPDSSWSYNPNAVYNYTTWNNTFVGLTAQGAGMLKPGYLLGARCLRESDEGLLTADQLSEALGYLDRGVPVVIAFDGHARDIVGYERNTAYAGGGQVILRNSYGTAEGVNGYDYVSFAVLQGTHTTNVALYVFEYDSDFPKFYQDINYTGNYVALAAGQHNTARLGHLGVPDNSISSISVPPGWIVYVFDADNNGGAYRSYTSSVASLVDAGFNDMTSSIYVTRNPVAKFFSDWKYTGFNAALTPGNYNFAALQAYGIRNDDISSVSLSGGISGVTLYSDDNFQGNSLTLYSSTDNLANFGFNDTVSSLVVF
jgi:hypothetical protein